MISKFNGDTRYFEMLMGILCNVWCFGLTSHKQRNQLGILRRIKHQYRPYLWRISCVKKEKKRIMYVGPFLLFTIKEALKCNPSGVCFRNVHGIVFQFHIDILWPVHMIFSAVGPVSSLSQISNVYSIIAIFSYI